MLRVALEDLVCLLDGNCIFCSAGIGKRTTLCGGANPGYGEDDDDGYVDGDDEGVGYVPDSPEVESATEAEGAGADERFGFHVVVSLWRKLI